MTEVYLNNKYIGEVEEASLFLEQFKIERRKGAISNNVNIYHDNRANEIRIEGTKGRARRPLIIVKDGVPLLTENHLKQLEKGEITWHDLIEQGVIESIDAGEEENALVALTENNLTPREEKEILKASKEAKLGKNVTKAMNRKEAIEYLKKL